MIYPWQQHQWQLLQSQLQNNSLHHAFLLSGSKGLGKLDFAREFARVLLCKNSNNAPCNSCDSCKWSVSGEHPDMFYLTALEKSKIIKVDQIRGLITDLAATSHQGGYQVVIVNPADSLALSSANALLKTLEEPMGRVVFLLVTTQANNIPATIISRCQLVPFKMQHYEEALTWVRQQLPNVQSQDAAILLRVSHGSPLQAVSYDGLGYMNIFKSLLADLCDLSKRSVDVVAVASRAAKQDVLLLLGIFADILSDMIKLYSNADVCHLMFQGHEDRLRSLVVNTSFVQLSFCFDQVVRFRDLLRVSSSVNTLLLLESLFIQWAQVFLKSR